MGVELDKTNIADKPAIIENMLDNLQVLAPDLTRETLLGMILSSLSYTFCTLRVQFKETENDKLNFPNLYTAFYLHSNMGKDYTSNLIKSTIFSPLKEFQNHNEEIFQSEKELRIFNSLKEKHSDWDAEKLENKTAEIMSKERRFSIGSNSAGTPEGLYAEMAGYEERRTGCIFVEQSEAGAFAESKSERKQDFLTCLYSGYDNRIEGRNIMNASFKTIEGVPVVAEFLSAPDIVKNNSNFRKRQTTALGRRIWVFMQEEWKKTTNIPNSAEKVTAKENLMNIGTDLFSNVLKKVKMMNDEPSKKSLDQQTNAVLNFAKGVYDNCYIPYKKKNIEIYNNTEDELIRLSISEYPFRACKVACLYAVLNHPSEFVIKAEDFQQAIKTVESTDGMKTLVGYAPELQDKYDYIVKALIEDYNSPDRPENDLYGKARISKIFENALKGKLKNSRWVARELLKSDNYEETKAILKEELQLKGYDLLATVGSTSFAGFKIKKLNMPVETVEEPETDVLSEFLT